MFLRQWIGEHGHGTRFVEAYRHMWSQLNERRMLEWRQITFDLPAPAPMIATTGLASTSRSSGMLVRSSFSNSCLRTTRITWSSTISTLYSIDKIEKRNHVVWLAIRRTEQEHTWQVSMTRMFFNITGVDTIACTMCKATETIVHQHSYVDIRARVTRSKRLSSVPFTNGNL